MSIPGLLSQWISGLLMLAPFASSDTEIEVTGSINERPYLDLTLRMLMTFGIEVEASPDYRYFRVPHDQAYQPANIELESDFSSLAYPILAAASAPSADVVLEGVSDPLGHPEGHIIEVFRAMGVPIDYDAGRRRLTVSHRGNRAQGTLVDCQDVPDLLPALAALAAVADGETVLTHVSHVRLKESDRVRSMMELVKLGADLSDGGDTLTIRGTRHLHGASLSSYNDHRVLMSLGVAACFADSPSDISYPRAFRISYPGFLDDMQSLGLNLTISELQSAVSSSGGRS